MNFIPNQQEKTVVAIDIGTRNIKVLIARILENRSIEVIGIGTSENRGMVKGHIANMPVVVQALKDAITRAEDMAEYRIHTAWVALPSPDLFSQNTMGRCVVRGDSVTANDVYYTLEDAKAHVLQPSYYLVNSVSLGVEVDGQPEWVEHPIGMYAKQLEAHYHLMMLPISSMQNIERALKSAGIGVEQLVVSGLATAHAALTAEEKDFGVCLVDVGAGTTNIVVYLQNKLILSQTLNVGGDHVTRDIAFYFNISFEQAERLKIRFGNLDKRTFRPEQMVTLPASGNDLGITLSKQELFEVMLARYDEIFAQVRAVLEDTGTHAVLERGVVMTGEAAMLEGILEVAMRGLSRKVQWAQLPAQVKTSDIHDVQLKQPIYLTTAGLLVCSQTETQRYPGLLPKEQESESTSIISRLTKFLTRWV